LKRTGEIQKTLIELLPNYTIRENTLYMLYPHRRFLSPKVRLFIDQLKDYVGKPPHWDNFREFKKVRGKKN